MINHDTNYVATKAFIKWYRLQTKENMMANLKKKMNMLVSTDFITIHLEYIM